MTATALPASGARLFPGVRQMLLVLLLACVALLPTSWAQQLQPIPALTARVTDTSGTLSPADKASLEARLAAFEQNKGSQIVILMVPTTQPEDIAATISFLCSEEAGFVSGQVIYVAGGPLD